MSVKGAGGDLAQRFCSLLRKARSRVPSLVLSPPKEGAVVRGGADLSHQHCGRLRQENSTFEGDPGL